MIGVTRPVFALVAGVCLLLVAGCDKKSNDPTTEADPGAGEPSQAPVEPQAPAASAPAPAPTTEQPQPTPGQNPTTPPAADIGSEDLDKFASALEKVRAVEAKYGARIKEAKSPQEAQTAQQEAMGVIEAELSKVGFTMEQYSILAQQISGDPQLQARLETRLQ
jgi:hypothetical protein